MLVIHAKEDVGAPESSSGGSGEGSQGSGGGEWMEETLGTQKPTGSHLRGEGVYIHEGLILFRTVRANVKTSRAL